MTTPATTPELHPPFLSDDGSDPDAPIELVPVPEEEAPLTPALRFWGTLAVLAAFRDLASPTRVRDAVSELINAAAEWRASRANPTALPEPPAESHAGPSARELFEAYHARDPFWHWEDITDERQACWEAVRVRAAMGRTS